MTGRMPAPRYDDYALESRVERQQSRIPFVRRRATDAELLAEGFAIAIRKERLLREENEGMAPIPVTEAWQCERCGIRTWSRCLTCDEPCCGICLLVHTCDSEEAGDGEA